MGDGRFVAKKDTDRKPPSLTSALHHRLATRLRNQVPSR